MLDNEMSLEGFYEGDDSQGRMQYFRIFDRSICKKSSKPVEGWEETTTRNPSTGEDVFSWVKKYSFLIVRIVDLEIETVEFDGGGRVTNWNFTLAALDAEGKIAHTATMQVGSKDMVLTRILKMGPNLDFSRPIYISVLVLITNRGITYLSTGSPRWKQTERRLRKMLRLLGQMVPRCLLQSLMKTRELGILGNNVAS